MILEVQPNARQIDNRLDTHSLELLGVTDARALQDQGRRQRAAAHDNLLPRPEGAAVVLLRVERLGGNGPHSDGHAVLDDDLVDLGVARQIEVVVHGARRVDVRMGAVTAAARIAVDPLEPVLGAVARDEVLQVINGGDALALGGTQEVILDGVRVVAERHLDGAVGAVKLAVV